MRLSKPPKSWAWRWAWSLACVLSCAAMLSACATDTARDAAAPPQIPADAQTAIKVAENGDEITEYRVAGQLRMVRVKPVRGPAFYLYDRNGDGRIDRDQTVSPVYFKIFGW